MELVYGQIPNNYYNIRNNVNNHFIISDNNNMYQIKVPEGSYDNNKLIDTLNGNYGNLFNEINNKYNFSKSINDLKSKSSFVKISKAGLDESHPHNITITKESPNYSR